jgi:protein kinase A
MSGPDGTESKLESAGPTEAAAELAKKNVFERFLAENKPKNQVSHVQTLTIQDAFDPHDSGTIHVTDSYLLLNNSLKTNTNGLANLNKLFSLNKLEKSESKENLQSPHAFNFYSSNLTAMNKGRLEFINILNKNNNNSNGSISGEPSKKNSLGKAMRNVNIADTKYVEYKKRWSEILKKDRRSFDAKWNHYTPNSACKLEDFQLKKTLGNGSFGRVILARHLKESKYYALKVLEKRNVIRSKQVEHTLNEKKIISCINFPFYVCYFESFKDNANLYIALEFVPGGEMFKHLVKSNRFSENLTRFYCAQVILAIEYLHNLDIIHRDLKPENTLISSDGYIKISDFGFAKYIKTRTYTLCGTPEYLAPEIIQSKPYGKAVDWWAVGILTYEMSTGRPPFQSDQPIKIYEKILATKYKVPSNLSDEIKDFMKCLIQPDVTKRYGNLKNGVDDIKTHKWLANVDWMAVYGKKLTAPFLPKVKSPDDTSNFDNYKEEAIPRSKEMLYEKEFADF